MSFFMKEFKGAILSQNHGRSQRGGQLRLKCQGSGQLKLKKARAPSTEMPPMKKIHEKKTLFLYFQFVLASLRTTVINNK